jgi:hypothetical protein
MKNSNCYQCKEEGKLLYKKNNLVKSAELYCLENKYFMLKNIVK